jgi:CheY-like chemotaxis protein
MSRVLVADDNLLSLGFFREAIALAGHEAVTARDGAEAIALASAQRFELILLDTRMPFVDGPEALRRIRAAPGPSRRASALATSADAGVCRAALSAAGFDDVLIKPIALDAMRVVLERYLGSATIVRMSLLDDASAGQKTGGDPAIVSALRQLLCGELDSLPAELRLLERDADTAALRDRLHRLDASAGFCGASALAQAIGELRARLDQQSGWPASAVSELLRVSAWTRAVLD